MQALVCISSFHIGVPSGVINPLYGIDGRSIMKCSLRRLRLGPVGGAARDCRYMHRRLFCRALHASIVPTERFFPQVVYHWLMALNSFGMGIAIIYRAGVRLSPAVPTSLVVAAPLANCVVGFGAIDLPRWIGWGNPAAQTVAALV
jgi:hypothetical protein